MSPPRGRGRVYRSIACRGGGGVNRDSLRCAAGSGPLVLRSDVMVSFDVLSIALVPPVEDWAGDEDRRERTRDNTNEEGERKIVDYATAEDEECERRKKRGEAGHHRTREHLVDRAIDNVPQRTVGILFQFFPNSIEYHDGVVDRITCDRQNRRDHGRRKAMA